MQTPSPTASPSPTPSPPPAISKLTYICSTDFPWYSDDRPKAFFTFNITGIFADKLTNLKADAFASLGSDGERLFPWSTFNNVYQLWVCNSSGNPILQLKTTDIELSAFPLVFSTKQKAVKNKLTGSLESILRGKKTNGKDFNGPPVDIVSRDPGGGTQSNNVDHDTWTGILAGLSQRGYPIAHWLGLCAWGEIDINSLQSVLQKNKIKIADSYFAIVPTLLYAKQLNPVSPTNQGTVNPIMTFETMAFAKPDGFTLEVEARPFSRDKDSQRYYAGAFLPMTGIACSENKSATQNQRNWRTKLPLNLGSVFDLLGLCGTSDSVVALSFADLRILALTLANDRADLGLRPTINGRNAKRNSPIARSLAETALSLLADNGLSDSQIIKPIDTLVAAGHSAVQATYLDFQSWVSLLAQAWKKHGGALDNDLRMFFDSGPHEPVAADKTCLLKELQTFLRNQDVLIDLFLYQWCSVLDWADRSKWTDVNNNNISPRQAWKTLTGDVDLVCQIPIKTADEQAFQFLRDRLIGPLSQVGRGLSNQYGDGITSLYWDSFTRTFKDEEQKPQNREDVVKGALTTVVSTYLNDRLASGRPGGGEDQFYFPPEFKSDSLKNVDKAIDAWAGNWAKNILGGSNNVAGDEGCSDAQPTATPSPTTSPQSTPSLSPTGTPSPTASPQPTATVPPPTNKDCKPTSATASPLPLMIVLPPLDLLNTDRSYDSGLAGAVVFGRRINQPHNKPAPWDPGNPEWQCLTIGEVCLGERRPAGQSTAGPSPAASPGPSVPLPEPFNPGQPGLISLALFHSGVTSGSAGIAQRLIEYNGRPLGVRLKECDDIKDAVQSPPDTSKGKNGEEPPHRLTEIGLDVFNRQLEDPATARGWGFSTGLRYDPDSQYQFLLAGIHRTGAVYPDLWMSNATPADLISATEFPKKVATDISDGSQNNYVQLRTFLRTVGVGKIRMAKAIEKTRGRLVPFIFPLAPKNVAPICRELPSISPDDRPGRQSLLFLHDSSETKIFFRPPATSIENWCFWERASENDKALETRRRYVAFGRALIRYLSTSGRPVADGSREDASDTVAQYLDDPAATGIYIRIQRRYPADPFNKLSKEYTFALSEIDISPFGQAKGANLDNFRPIVQRYWKQNLVIKRSIELTHDRTTGALTPVEGSVQGNDKMVELQVAAGEVWEVTVVPCIATSTGADKRFQHDVLYYAENADDSSCRIEKTSPEGDTYVLARGSEMIFFVEASMPSLQEFESQNPSGSIEEWRSLILPQPQEVWNSLVVRPNSATKRLEIKLEGIISNEWAYISRIRLEVQQWRWLGVPLAKQGASVFCDNDELCRNPLLRPSEFDQLVYSLDSAALKQDPFFADFLDAEVRAFADRDELDAIAHEKRVSILPQVPNSGSSNNFQLFLDPGEQEAVPRYFRVKITAYSRYEGLPSFDGGFVDGLSNGTFQGQANQGVYTGYRRAVTKGRLSKPLAPPKVKLVVPLIEPASLSKNTQAKSRLLSFIVLTRDTIVSPFHSVVGRVEVVHSHTILDDSTKDKYRLEVGPDPITTTLQFAETAASDKLSPRDLAKKGIILGRPIGLTFEREASSPLFANAAFLFDYATPVLENSDVFLKIHFRWVLNGGVEAESRGVSIDDLLVSDGDSGATASMSRLDVGPETAPWEAKLLAPFDELWTDPSGNGAIATNELWFRRADPNQIKFFTGDQHVQQKTIFPPGKNFVLLFLTYREVPDFLGGSSGFAPEEIYLINHAGDARFLYQFYTRSAPNPASNSNSKFSPRRYGQFLLLLVDPRNFDAKTGQTAFEKTAFKPSGKTNGTIENLIDLLFPDSADQIPYLAKDDAEGMIIRSSMSIPRRD